MNDLIGPIVVTTRDDPTVLAITPRVRGAQLAQGDVAPAVTFRLLANSRMPFGRGTARLGLQQPRLVAKCYGSTEQQAEQLAGAVSDALHKLPPQVIGGKTLRLVLDESWGAAIIDPVTKWPTVDVVFEVTGNA